MGFLKIALTLISIVYLIQNTIRYIKLHQENKD